MVITNYPVGLHARTNYFRCCSTTWDQECRDFILSRMKGSANNIKPIFVIETDESVTMYEPNDDLTDLIKTDPAGEERIWNLQNKQKAHWMKERTKIQKDEKLTPDQKSSQIKALE